MLECTSWFPRKEKRIRREVTMNRKIASSSYHFQAEEGRRDNERKKGIYYSITRQEKQVLKRWGCSFFSLSRVEDAAFFCAKKAQKDEISIPCLLREHVLFSCMAECVWWWNPCGVYMMMLILVTNDQHANCLFFFIMSISEYFPSFFWLSHDIVGHSDLDVFLVLLLQLCCRLNSFTDLTVMSSRRLGHALKSMSREEEQSVVSFMMLFSSRQFLFKRLN